MSAIIPQRLLSAHVTSGLRQKPCSWICWDSLLRKQGFSWRFLFPASLFFTQLKVVNLWNIAALKQQLLNSDCLWLLRWGTFFLSSILFGVRKATPNLRCYLMVVFCLFSPDIATCSLTLYKPLIIAVVKRLITFVNLPPSTTAPMFRGWERSLFAQGCVKMISIFSCPWHPSAFQLLKFDFINTYWSDSCNFCIKSTTDTRSIIFQAFGCGELFLVIYWRQNIQFSGFFWRASGIFFSPVFRGSFETLIVSIFCLDQHSFERVMW